MLKFSAKIKPKEKGFKKKTKANSQKRLEKNIVGEYKLQNQGVILKF